MFGAWKPRYILLIACVTLAGVAGCAPYRFGSAGLFPQNIRTVHVPVVRNETFRHDLGKQLTEAVIREIELRTPYKVTDDPNADSTLICRITAESKRVLTETRGDDVRAFDSAVVVESKWLNRSGQALMQNSVVPENLPGISFSQDSRVVPEAGQSIETGNLDNIENLAARIVSQMEVRW